MENTTSEMEQASAADARQRGGDERFWSEVRVRLAEMDKLRRARDVLSADEERALAMAAGALELLAKFDAPMRQRALRGSAAAVAAAARAQPDLAAQLQLVIERESAQPPGRHDERKGNLAQLSARSEPDARAKHSTGRTRRSRAGRWLVSATLAISFVLALAVGAGVFWRRPAAPESAAPSRWDAVQSKALRQPRAQDPLQLKMDADSTGFAARAGARGQR